jgi:hypothetical protein
VQEDLNNVRDINNSTWLGGKPVALSR